MSLSLGSYSTYFYAFKNILAIALDIIIENSSPVNKIVENLFFCINQLKLPEFLATEDEKKVRKWCIDKGYTKDT
jgi:Spindle pole body interacting protein.